MTVPVPTGTATAGSSFFGWWLQELSDIVRRTEKGGQGWQVLVRREGGGIDCHTRQRGKFQVTSLRPGQSVPRDQLSAPPPQVVIRLKPHEVVQRTLSLPRGERRDIEAIIRNQIEFLAPWPADRVLFDFETLPGADEQDRVVPVQVTIAGRDIVEETQQQLQALGIKAGVVDAGEDLEQPARINLLRSMAQDGVVAGRGMRVALGALLAAALAVTALGGVRLLLSYRELGRIDASIQSIRGLAEEAQRLGKSTVEMQARNARLAGRKTADPAAMLVLEGLSRVIPGDTWLSSIELRGRDIRITGQSPNAASLIALLEGTKAFTKVRFAAPTTREPGKEIDTFSIAAEVSKLAELVQ